MVLTFRTFFSACGGLFLERGTLENFLLSTDFLFLLLPWCALRLGLCVYTMVGVQSKDTLTCIFHHTHDSNVVSPRDGADIAGAWQLTLGYACVLRECGPRDR